MEAHNSIRILWHKLRLLAPSVSKISSKVEMQLERQTSTVQKSWEIHLIASRYRNSWLNLCKRTRIVKYSIKDILCRKKQLVNKLIQRMLLVGLVQMECHNWNLIQRALSELKTHLVVTRPKEETTALAKHSEEAT